MHILTNPNREAYTCFLNVWVSERRKNINKHEIGVFIHRQCFGSPLYTSNAADEYIVGGIVYSFTANEYQYYNYT